MKAYQLWEGTSRIRASSLWTSNQVRYPELLVWTLNTIGTIRRSISEGCSCRSYIDVCRTHATSNSLILAGKRRAKSETCGNKRLRSRFMVKRPILIRIMHYSTYTLPEKPKKNFIRPKNRNRIKQTPSQCFLQTTIIQIRASEVRIRVPLQDSFDIPTEDRKQRRRSTFFLVLKHSLKGRPSRSFHSDFSNKFVPFVSSNNMNSIVSASAWRTKRLGTNQPS